MSQKLSVTVITYNEEENIQEALESVTWADEIVVVDSFSTDRTVEICKKYTDKIFSERFIGFGRLKNLAIDKATHDWILSLDADERVTPELRDEITEELVRGPKADGFSIPRKSHFLGHWVRHCGWYPDYRSMQLFNRRKVRYTEDLVHEKADFLRHIRGADARKAYLHGHVLQYPFRTISQYIAKMDRYSTLMAEEMSGRGEVFRAHQLITHPLFTFVKMYALRQGFRDGMVGLILSIFYAYYTFLKYAKLWERTRIR